MTAPRSAFGLLALLAGLAAAQPAPAPAPKPVQAPHYGDTLFHFYQDHYFSAITALMVSQHFGRVSPHDDEAEVLRGGMLLSYGLHQQAAEVFAQLIERQAAPAVRDRAWFFLARIRHQRELLGAAQEALNRIAAPLPIALEEERQLLQAQLMMARQDHAGAAALLQGLKGSPTAGLYARFNLGVALIRAGNVEEGKAWLDDVGRAPGANEEMRALRDRANLALGFAELQAEEPREARAALQRVRLNAQQSNKALLGFGWAATALKDPQLALVPFTELADRSPADSAVLEAQIALPYAMAEFGAYSRALEGYEQAVTRFGTERQALQQAIASIRGGALVQALLAHNPGEAGLGAFSQVDRLPPLPHATQLAPLLAGHDFQQAYRHLRDLQFVQANLARWQADLGAFGDMLANRQQAFAQKLPAVRAQSGAINLPALQQRYDALAAELKTAVEQTDAAAFANPQERAHQTRIAAGQATLQATAGQAEAAELNEAQERLRRVSGALSWQLSQQLPERSWVATKALRVAEAALGSARDRDAALLLAQQQEPGRHVAIAQRIATLDQRLQALAPRAVALDREAQIHLQDIAVAELERQQQRLDDYAAQARLAIAQLHDRAQVAQRSDSPAVEGTRR
jgi:hypothetical protein